MLEGCWLKCNGRCFLILLMLFQKLSSRPLSRALLSSRPLSRALLFSMLMLLSSSKEGFKLSWKKKFFVKKNCKWGVRRAGFSGVFGWFCMKLPFYKMPIIINGS